MVQSTNYQKVFRGMLSSQSFELPEEFFEEATWKTLGSEERSLLAQLFLLSAESKIGQSCVTGIHDVLKSYRAACQITPESAKTWYRLGSFLVLQDDEKLLDEAVDVLTKAVEIDEYLFDAQYSLASAALRLGAMKKNTELLYVADTAFSNAAKLRGDSEGGFEFNWHWGLVWFLVAKESGEPVDLLRSVKLFQQAYALGGGTSEFCNDYANALVELSLFTSNIQYMYEALELYSEAITRVVPGIHTNKDRAGWLFNMGCCFQHLFDRNLNKDEYVRADRAFAEAAELCCDMAVIWQRWGQLLFKASRLRQDLSLAGECVEKLNVAEELGTVNFLTSALRSQALLLVGSKQERYELFSAAITAAKRSIALQEQQGGSGAEPVASFALCQYELGRYFNDESYFEKALEITQKSLLEYPRSAFLWHVSAQIKFMLAKERESVRLLKESALGFALASRSSYAQFPDFWNEWGLVLFVLSEWTEDVNLAFESLEKFEEVKKFHEVQDLSLSFNMACVLDLLGDSTNERKYYDRAIELLQEIVRVEPSFSKAFSQLAACYLHLGEIEGGEDLFCAACDLFERYLQENQEDESIWIDYAISLIHKGFQRRNRGVPQEWFEAEEALGKALLLGNSFAHYHKACLYALMENTFESMESLHLSLKQGALPPVQAILEDKWLEFLDGKEVFHSFIEKAEKIQKYQNIDFE